MEAIDQYKDACVNDALGQNLSPAGLKIEHVTPVQGGDLDKMVDAFLEAAPTIFTNSGGNTTPSLKSLNWEAPAGDTLRAKCPNSGADYLVGESNDGGHFISEVRQHALWKKIEGEYDTMQAAKDACEHHRNQRLRDLLQ